MRIRLAAARAFSKVSATTKATVSPKWRTRSVARTGLDARWLRGLALVPSGAWVGAFLWVQTRRTPATASAAGVAAAVGGEDRVGRPPAAGTGLGPPRRLGGRVLVGPGQAHAGGRLGRRGVDGDDAAPGDLRVDEIADGRGRRRLDLVGVGGGPG